MTKCEKCRAAVSEDELYGDNGLMEMHTHWL